MGAGNSLLLMQLHVRGLLQGKTIGILDPDSKRSKDRTFCFWATDEEIERFALRPLISKSWDDCRAGGADAQPLAPFRYHHVSGLDVYNHVREILAGYEHEWIAAAFRGEEGLPIQTETRIIHAGKVYDSRPPKFREPAAGEAHLKQSFLGWEISTENDAFNPDCFVMMDFSVEQQEATQFMYVLPFDRRHALVECTRFGLEPIDEKEAAGLLQDYITRHYGAFRIHEEERGSIPMCSAETEPVYASEVWIPTGARAGNLKPSTGYSFMNSCRHAVALAENQKSPGTSIRYRFYDRLLLKILEQQAAQGKRIFERLFCKVPATRVLRFLSEEVSFREELGILSSLPKSLFIRAALRDVLGRMNLMNLLPWLLTGALLLLHWLGLEAIGMGLLITGLLVIGLPHGAIDHLLETGKLQTPIRAGFILKYLAASALMGAVWFLNPVAGLIIFLLYSSWHFGETEFSRREDGPGWRSFLWGLAMLGLILLSHLAELNQVLRELHIPALPEFMQSFGWVCLALYLFMGGTRGLSGWYLIPALALPLLQAFGVFFIADHSAKSAVHLMKGFKANRAVLYRKALPFTMGAIALGLLFFSGALPNAGDTTGLFFIFLSCLSFPHVLAMHRFYQRTR